MGKGVSRAVGLSRTAALIIVLGTAAALAAGTLAFACWVSALPAISPVSLSLSFQSWTAILTFTFHTWWISLSVLAVVFLPVFLRPSGQNVRDDPDVSTPDTG
jgi:hypothetical protein